MAVPAMPGPRLAVIETEIVPCPLETFFDRPARACHLTPIRAGQLGQGGFRRAECEVVSQLAGVVSAAADQEPALPPVLVLVSTRPSWVAKRR